MDPYWFPLFYGNQPDFSETPKNPGKGTLRKKIQKILWCGLIPKWPPF